MSMLFINRRKIAIACTAAILTACSTMPNAPDGARKHERDKNLPTSIKADSSQDDIVISAYSSRAERQSKQAAPAFQEALALMEQQKLDDASALLSQLAVDYPL